MTYSWGWRVLCRSGTTGLGGLSGHGGTGDECGVIGVDVSGLDVDEALGVVGGGAETFAQELGNNFD